MKFELKDVEVTILHVMTTKAQAESQLYSSVKIGVDSIPDSAASALMGGRSAGEIRQSFFADGKSRFPKVHELTPEREYLAKHMVTFEGLAEVRVTKLWKPKLILLSEGGFGLQFSLQADVPSAEWMHQIHELMHKKCTLHLVQDTTDLVDSAEEKEPASKQSRRGPKAEDATQHAPAH